PAHVVVRVQVAEDEPAAVEEDDAREDRAGLRVVVAERDGARRSGRLGPADQGDLRTRRRRPPLLQRGAQLRRGQAAVDPGSAAAHEFDELKGLLAGPQRRNCSLRGWGPPRRAPPPKGAGTPDRKSTRLNSSHVKI